MFVPAEVCPDDDNAHFSNTCQHGGNGCSANAQLGHAAVAVNEQIVQYDVHDYRSHAAHHGLDAAAGFPQAGGIDLCHHKERQPQQHDVQVLLGIGHGEGGVHGGTFSVEV